jgi:signal transduction histidine kinase
MAASKPGLARALTDGDDCLLSADEPLASLQLHCGGELPGMLAIPALLETVRKSRRYQLRLARNITAHTMGEAVSAWVEVEPRSDGDPGCEISLGSWHTAPLPAEDDAIAAQRSRFIDRNLAELGAILDRNQKLMAVTCEASDLQSLAAAMSEGTGRHWTDFLLVEGLEHRQPVHWRLLDGAPVTIEGSDRGWHAVLQPRQAENDAEPHGFELLLVADRPLPPSLAVEPRDVAHAQRRTNIIGQEIAPALRQPIARIIANAETIRAKLAGPLSEDYARYATDIANAGQLLLGLLDDLSDLEVVESDDFSTAPDRIDLAVVARQAAGILGVRAREKAIAIDPPRHGETLPAIAEFRRVLQILINLIGNAIRYSPPDSQVWIRLERDGDLARIVVADQGPGLSPEQADVVFEKFERLGRSDEGGSGLGLYISRRLARAMGGDLTVESAAGQGARFVLRVPLTGRPTGQRHCRPRRTA